MDERGREGTSRSTFVEPPGRAGDHEARAERRRIARERARRRRMRLLIAALALGFVLAGILLTLILSGGEQTGASLPSRTTAPAIASLGAAASSSGEKPAATGSATTSTIVYPPHTLSVKAQPSAVNLSMERSDSTTVTTKTPFKDLVAGGPLKLTFTRKGYNDVVRDVFLDEDLALTVYMDPEGLLHRSLGRFTTGSAPKQVAFPPDGKEIWSSLLGGHGVEVFDTEGHKLGSVDLGQHGAVEVIFTRDGSTAYASQMESASVFEIDRATRTVRRQLPTEGVWTKVMALSPDEKTLYAANWSSNDVSEIDLETGGVRRRIPTVVTPRGLYATPDGKRLYVAGYENGEIQRIDLATGKGTVLIKTGGAMRHMVGSPDGTRLYADDMARDVVFVVDLTTDSVTELAKTDEKPNTIDLSPDGRLLYVSCRGENNPESYYIPGPEWGSVVVLDALTGRTLDAIVGGNQCTGLDVSPDGSTLAFSDFLDNRVRLYAIPPTQTLVEGDGGRAQSHLADIPKRE